MKAETPASLYSSLCLGVCVGPGPGVGKGFEEAEKGLCIADLDGISASSRCIWESHPPYELLLGGCTKPMFTGDALASGHLKRLNIDVKHQSQLLGGC